MKLAGYQELSRVLTNFNSEVLIYVVEKCLSYYKSNIHSRCNSHVAEQICKCLVHLISVYEHGQPD